MRFLVSIAALAALLLVPSAASAQAAPDRLGVIMLSGLGTSSDTVEEGFVSLREALKGVGIAPSAVSHYSYSGYRAWGTDDSCESLNTAEANLAATLRALRDQHAYDHVALIGHSRGGLVALQTPVDYADLTPFVSTVVAIDTPFLGISDGKADAFDVRLRFCEPAITELLNRRGDADTWSAWNAQAVDFLSSRGVTVRAIGNKSDCIYNPIACHAFWGSFFTDDTWAEAVSADPNVQHWYDIPTDQGVQASHGIALRSPAVLADVVGAIQGQ